MTITVRVAAQPQISSLSVAAGPQWSQVWIYGSDFADVRGESRVVFGPGQIEAAEYLSWSDTAINCRVPKGLDIGPNNVVVLVSGLASNAAVFTVTDPSELLVDDSNSTGTENGTARWPFSTIGEGVAAATAGDAVKVAAGTYGETVAVADMALSVRGGYAGGGDYAAGAGDFAEASRSLDRATNPTVIDGGGVRRCVTLDNCAGGEVSGFVLQGGSAADHGGGIRCSGSSTAIQFCTILACAAGQEGGGIYCTASSPAISHTLITGNQAGVQGGGIACANGSSPAIRQSTIAQNEGGGIACTGSSSPSIRNTILWGSESTTGFQVLRDGSSAPSVAYSDLAGGVPPGCSDGGENLDADPLFVLPGQRNSDGSWSQGDYHLQSVAGHWSPGGWVSDAASSPCIDMGDATPAGSEPVPNGNWINLGTYGGTAQASKTPPTLFARISAPDPIAAETAAGEPSDPGKLRIHRTGRSGSLTVNFMRLGTATFGAAGDYTLAVGGVALAGTSVTITNGQEGVDIDVIPVDDATVEPTESVVFALTSGTGYAVDPSAANGMACVYILDNEPAVSIAATDAQAAETSAGQPADTGMFRVTRVGGASNITVTFVRSGTATFGKDYTLRANGAPLATTSVAVPATPGYVDIEVVPIDDLVPEGLETVVLTPVATSAYSVASPGSATVSLLDNEPVVSIAATAPTASESGERGRFRISRVGGTGDVLVGLTLSGTAKFGSDYWLHVGGVPIVTPSVLVPTAPGYVDVEVVAVDDAVAEPTETVVVALISGKTYAADPDPSRRQAQVDILDNEPVVSVAALDPSAAETKTGEPPDTGLFRISRQRGTGDLTVAFSLSGTAKLGSDYVLRANGVALVTTAVVIPETPGHVDIEVVPIDDAAAEGPETATLSLSAGPTYAVGPSKSATVTIADNEPVVSVAALDPTAAETGPGVSPDTGIFRISQVGARGNLTVPFKLSGTAKLGTDYTLRVGGAPLAATSVTVPLVPGYVDIELVPVDDAIPEAPETAVLTLGTGAAYAVSPAAPSAQVTILDNEPTLSVVATEPTAGEPANPGVFRISRTHGGAASVTVRFALSGTATFATTPAKGDYLLMAGGAVLATTYVSVPAAPGYVDVAVVPIDDKLSEATEAVILTLVAGTGYGLDANLAKRTATVTIADNDPSSPAPPDAQAPDGLGILVVPDHGQAPLEVTAMALGVEADTHCDWDFGGGSKGYGLAIVHTYWSPGTYTIKLSANGETVEATVVVAEAPAK